MYSDKLGNYVSHHQPEAGTAYDPGGESPNRFQLPPRWTGKAPSTEDVDSFVKAPPVSHAAEVEAKIEAAKTGTQSEKIIALRESVEALWAHLKAKGIL